MRVAIIIAATGVVSNITDTNGDIEGVAAFYPEPTYLCKDVTGRTVGPGDTYHPETDSYTSPPPPPSYTYFIVPKRVVTAMQVFGSQTEAEFANPGCTAVERTSANDFADVGYVYNEADGSFTAP